MTTFTQMELRSRLIRSVELTVAGELTDHSQATPEKQPPRIDAILYDALVANGVSPRNVGLDVCKDLVVRATRFAKRLSARKELVAS